MTNPTRVIDYIIKNFHQVKKMKNMDIHSRELCSALAYQFLLLENNIEKSVENFYLTNHILVFLDKKMSLNYFTN